MRATRRDVIRLGLIEDQIVVSKDRINPWVLIQDAAGEPGHFALPYSTRDVAEAFTDGWFSEGHSVTVRRSAATFKVARVSPRRANVTLPGGLQGQDALRVDYGTLVDAPSKRCTAFGANSLRAPALGSPTSKPASPSCDAKPPE